MNRYINIIRINFGAHSYEKMQKMSTYITFFSQFGLLRKKEI